MKLVGDGGPPPTAHLVAKLAGGEPDERVVPGTLLHLAYGVGAGTVLAVGAPLVGLGVGSPAVSIGLGLAYGVALMVGGMVFWVRAVIGIEPDKETVVAFAAAHAAYGVVLGGFLSTGVLA